MTMGQDGDGYCLPNSRPRLPNVFSYSYPIPDSLKFIIPSLYLSGIGYLDPVSYPIQIRKIIFFKENLKNLILEKIN